MERKKSEIYKKWERKKEKKERLNNLYENNFSLMIRTVCVWERERERERGRGVNLINVFWGLDSWKCKLIYNHKWIYIEEERRVVTYIEQMNA